MVVATTAAPAAFCAAPQAGSDGSSTATGALEPCQSAASKKTPPEESDLAAEAAIQATAAIPVLLQLSASHCFSPPPLQSPPEATAEAGTLQVRACI